MNLKRLFIGCLFAIVAATTAVAQDAKIWRKSVNSCMSGISPVSFSAITATSACPSTKCSPRRPNWLECDIYRLDGKKTHSITEVFRGGGEFLNSAYIIAGGITSASTEKTYFFDREGNYLFTVDGMFEAKNERGTNNYLKNYQVDDVMARILRSLTNIAP